ncbi:FAD-binding oxidoreductase [Halopseudomonas pelagia]|uniref:FAD-binding oxidoreductase n=1 Tax=Halopseudomonas pelagia TaxID=553151 RepID=UPI0003A16C69|nr:FAD-binding oxidoreductase [Halopseudomonas pelagia]
MISIEVLNALQAQLPKLEWITSRVHIKRLSRDFYWFSPLLVPQLMDKQADLVVRPRDEAELTALVSACVSLAIPMTVRGGGTGNYGQAVPLAGGVVIDMTSCTALEWLCEGLVRVQAGMKIGELEERVRERCWELRCMPSTYRAASIGGLFAGGFGGIGSINYGPISAPGTVQCIRILTIEDRPQVLELRGEDLLVYHHTYGTNGILLDLELALAPARNWDEYLFDFDNIEAAYGFCRAMLDSTGIEKRELSLYDSRAASYFRDIPFSLLDGHFLVMALVAPHNRQSLVQLRAEYGGKQLWTQTFAEAKASGLTLMEHCWNHSTLQALKHDKGFTNLQTNYDSDRVLEQLAELKAQVADEVLIHLEFIRLANSQVLVTGLPLVRYSTDTRLAELMALHESLGIKINNSHTYMLEDGKHGGALSPAILASKAANDPHSLLNPGKIRPLEGCQ